MPINIGSEAFLVPYLLLLHLVVIYLLLRKWRQNHIFLWLQIFDLRIPWSVDAIFILDYWVHRVLVWLSYYKHVLVYWLGGHRWNIRPFRLKTVIFKHASSLRHVSDILFIISISIICRQRSLLNPMFIKYIFKSNIFLIIVYLVLLILFLQFQSIYWLLSIWRNIS